MICDLLIFQLIFLLSNRKIQQNSIPAILSQSRCNQIHAHHRQQARYYRVLPILSWRSIHHTSSSTINHQQLGLMMKKTPIFHPLGYVPIVETYSSLLRTKPDHTTHPPPKIASHPPTRFIPCLHCCWYPSHQALHSIVPSVQSLM